MQRIIYKKVIGLLMYAMMAIRIDLVFFVSVVSNVMFKTQPLHQIIIIKIIVKQHHIHQIAP